jgi:hypothetical protein
MGKNILNHPHPPLEPSEITKPRYIFLSDQSAEQRLQGWRFLPIINLQSSGNFKNVKDRANSIFGDKNK